MKITVELNENGEFESVYVEVRTGKAEDVGEGSCPHYYLADYDAKGRLLSVTVTDRGMVAVPDCIKMRRKR